MKQIFLALFILFLSCSGKEKKVTNENLQLSDKWIEYKTKDSIPKLLKLVLDKLNKESFKIANQDEVFNATDVMLNDSIPNKQLRLLATKDNKWRLVYIQGGFGKYYVYNECKIINNSISDFKICETLIKLENNDTITKLISKNKITLKDIRLK